MQVVESERPQDFSYPSSLKDPTYILASLEMPDALKDQALELNNQLADLNLTIPSDFESVTAFLTKNGLHSDFNISIIDGERASELPGGEIHEAVKNILTDSAHGICIYALKEILINGTTPFIKVNGLDALEHSVAHELAHSVGASRVPFIVEERFLANGDLYRTLWPKGASYRKYYLDRKGEGATDRNSFRVKKIGGGFLEEAFAEYWAGAYRAERLKDKLSDEVKEIFERNGHSDLANVSLTKNVLNGNCTENLPLCFKYIFASGSDTVCYAYGAFAAQALDYIAKKEPSLIQAMVASRYDSTAYREIPKIFKSFSSGNMLYRFLRGLSISKSDMRAGLRMVQLYS